MTDQTVRLETVHAVCVANPETGKVDLRHPTTTCAGDGEWLDGPPVTVEIGPEPPSCSACGKTFERDKTIPAPARIVRRIDEDEGDDGPTMH